MKIFLDDIRQPVDCVGYMYQRIGLDFNLYAKEDWIIARNYQEFVDLVETHKGEITHISFDHDLAEGHYHQNMQEGVLNYNSEDFVNDYHKTGYHCAKYLKELYKNTGLELPIMFVHSMNPVGTQNIINLFKEK